MDPTKEAKSTRRVGRWIAAAVALMIFAALAWLVYVKVAASLAETAATKRGGTTAAVAVDVAPVTRATLRDLRVLTGTLEPQSQYVAAPKIGGRLEELTVDIGDQVERDQVLARLDDQELQLAVRRAEAELAVARSELEQARSRLGVVERDYERIASLREQRVASESQLDQAKAALDAQRAEQAVAEAQVARAEAALRAAQVQLSHAELRARWPDGGGPWVVGERHVNEGAMLSANDPIVSLLDIGTLLAVVYVTERDYSRLSVGQRARVMTDAYPGRAVEGRIVRLAPRFRTSSRQARVEVAVANSDGRFKPGMFVRAEIELGSSVDATVVPIESVVRRDEAQGVFLVDAEGAQVQFVPVRLGIEEAGRVEVLEPALTGRVVVLGQHLLSDGSAVALPTAPAPQDADGAAAREARR